MTERQALAKARRRWGRLAYIKKYPKGSEHTRPCAVGVVVNIAGLARFFSVKGQGDNWTEAFANVHHG